MNIKMEFVLPEDQEEFDLAMNGWKYKTILYGFNHRLRDMLKHGGVDKLSTQEVRDELYAIAKEYEVEI